MNPTKILEISRDRRKLRFRLGDLTGGPLEVTFAARLRELIERGEFITGDMLPDEQDFAEHLDVGHELVRRVLHTLEAERRLQGRDDCAWFVA